MGAEVVPVRVPGEAVPALRALPVALHQPGTRFQKTAAQEHRLAEQIAAIAFAFRRLSPARSTALRTASDEMTSSACAWFSRIDWLIGQFVQLGGLLIELIHQAQPPLQHVQRLRSASAAGGRAGNRRRWDCRPSAVDRTCRRARRQTVRLDGRPPRPCGAAPSRRETSAQCRALAWPLTSPCAACRPGSSS